MNKKMNPEVKAAWISALRSGEYGQTEGRLRSSTGFCCLGVLTDMYLKEVGREWTVEDHFDVKTYSISAHLDSGLVYCETAILSEYISNWAGLMQAGDFRLPNGDLTALSTLNDDGFTFDQIADVIDYFF